MSAGEMDEQEETSLIKNKKIHSGNVFIDKQADLLYDKMKFYLDADFNLFVHGVGTKKDFLNSFVLSQLKDENVGCVINGYHSGTTIKAVIKEMEKFIKDKLHKNRGEKTISTYDSFEYVKRIFNSMSHDDRYDCKSYFMVIHSMDMGMLKGAEFQEMLAELASIEAVKLIVSVDNCKSGVLFTDHQLDMFNFVCIQADTF